MSKSARCKDDAPKLHKEVKPSGSNFYPSGKSNPVGHGPRGSGASPAGEGRNTDLSTFSREQV